MQSKQQRRGHAWREEYLFFSPTLKRRKRLPPGDDARLIADAIASQRVTHCPPAYAFGSRRMPNVEGMAR